ncbi:Ulp1 protease family, C-terminal catalytic domain [Sesbania bispinosa]|nr:Ulp1 protease family, C-terminal catalytic domain [Sesbania bispinosa]
MRYLTSFIKKHDTSALSHTYPTSHYHSIPSSKKSKTVVGRGKHLIIHNERHSPEHLNAMISGTRQNRKRLRVNEITLSSSSKEKSNAKFSHEGDSFSSNQNGRQQNNENRKLGKRSLPHFKVMEYHKKAMKDVGQLRYFVENMTTLMVKNKPMTDSPHALDGHSFVKSNEASPMICALTKGKETEEIMSRLCHPSERPLEVGRSIKGKGNSNKEGGTLQGKKIAKEGTKKGASIPRVSYITLSYKQVLLDEVLIKSQKMVGKRASLKTLMPNKHLHHDVLNLLVCNLTEEKHYLDGSTSTHWFLPTMFAQYALDSLTPANTAMELYQGTFMGKVEFVRKIFVPINDEAIHWFLLVIDMDKNNLILLDSNQSDLRRERRRFQVRKVVNWSFSLSIFKSFSMVIKNRSNEYMNPQALFLQEMMMEPSFYNFSHTVKPDVAGFTLIEPNGIGQELPASNDSGIWVANWMEDYDWDDEYNQHNVETLQRITIASRMRLAIDLVLHEYNEMRDDVIKRATKNWKAFQQRRDTIFKSIFGYLDEND